MIVDVVMPAWVDDPRRPSGGNVYDRRLCDGLAAAGWEVHEHHGLDELPEGALVIVDGLLASRAPELVEQAARLRLVVLVHLPVGPDETEARVLRAAETVVATSRWTASWLRSTYGLDEVVVATPGVDPAPVTTPSEAGSRLLCVGAVTRVKGTDLLLDALAEVADLEWTCRVAGAIDLEPDLALRPEPRARFLGALDRAELAEEYAGTDLVVVSSRMETYGMVATEALARGIPVLATDVGGVREAVGDAAMLVPADGLAAGLRRWLTDPAVRAGARAAALRRRESLTGWDVTTTAVIDALREAVPA